MGGKVKVESEGSGKGTTFVLKMQAISKIVHSQDVSSLCLIPKNRNQSSNISKEVKEILKEQKDALNAAKSDSNNNRFSIIMDKLSPSA